MRQLFQVETDMTRTLVAALYVAAPGVTIVGADLLCLKNRFWVRLLVNISIVLAFVVFYRGFLKTA